MCKSKSNLIVLVLVTMLMSCTESSDKSKVAQESFDLSDATYFNEFVACSTGPEYSPELMNEMISEWRDLIDPAALVGGWIYLPASDTNTYPEGAWGELGDPGSSTCCRRTWVEQLPLYRGLHSNSVLCL